MTQTTVVARLSPGLGFAGLSFVVNAIVVLGSAVATSRLYGVEVIGLYALAIAPWLLLVNFSTVSEQIAMVRALALIERGSPEATGLFYAVFSVSFLLTLFMSFPVLIVSGLALAGPLGQAESVAPAALILAGYVLFENPGWNLESVLSAYSEGRRLFWARLSVVSSFAVTAVAARSFTATVWGLAVATVLSFFIGFVVKFSVTRDLLGLLPERESFRVGIRRLPDLLRFGAGLLPGQVFIGATLQLPLILLANSVGLRELGAFSRASTTAVRLNEAGFRINEMLLPDLVAAANAGDLATLAAVLRRVLRVALIGLVLVAAVAGGAAEAVMNVFGDRFDAAAGALLFLVLVHVCYVACSVVGTAFNALGRPYLNSAFSSLRFVVGLGLVVLLVGGSGITAASAGLLVGYAIELAVRVVVLDRLLRSAGDTIGHGITGSVLGLGLIARLGYSYLTTYVAIGLIATIMGHGPSSLLVGSTVGTVAYLGAAWAVGLIEPHERRVVLDRARFSRVGRLRPS